MKCKRCDNEAVKGNGLGRPPALCAACRAGQGTDREHTRSFREALSRRLKEELDRQELSRADLAALARTSTDTVYNVVCGYHGVSATVLARLAFALGVSMDWLCGISEVKCLTESRSEPALSASEASAVPTAGTSGRE